MLRNNEKGYAVMNKQLDAFSFEGDLETCKKYCRNGDVIAERIPYKFGISIKITWHKYWAKPIRFKKCDGRANIFYLHFNWYDEYTHKTGKIVYKS